MPCRIHAARRDFGYPFCGRQSDVTGTPLGTRDVAPLEQRDVMTFDSFNLGRWDPTFLYSYVASD